jgi:hypothetical protein
VQPLLKTIWRLLQKLNIDLPYDPAISKDILLRLLQRYLHTHVYCRAIHNSQDAPLLMIGLRKLVFIHNEILLSHEEELNLIILK